MKRISLSILLLVPTPAFAEDGLSLGGSTRLRYEVIDGQPRAGFNESDDLVSIRTIVTGEYRTGRLRLGAELYASRVYGGDVLFNGEDLLAMQPDVLAARGVFLAFQYPV